MKKSVRDDEAIKPTPSSLPSSSSPSDDKKRASDEVERPSCPKIECGSPNIIKKGWRENSTVRKYWCKDCRKWFCDNSRKQWTKEESYEFAYAYYHSVVGHEHMPDNRHVWSLAEMGKLTGKSKAAMSRKVREIVTPMESGLDTTKRKLSKLGRDLVVDSKHSRIKGQKCYCWLAVDAKTGEPIHYLFSNSNDQATVRRFLNQLKEGAGYLAVAIIADMGESILSEAKEIFTDDLTEKKPLLQACTIHRLRQIAREWPYLAWKGRPELSKKKKAKKNGETDDNNHQEEKPNATKRKRKGRRLSPQKMTARIQFSELAARLLYADTISQKNALEAEMKALEEQWSIDSKVMRQYKSLMRDLKYYHTREELGDCPFDNNKAETLNGVLEKKLSRMQGFKTFESGRIHLKGFWQTYRWKKFPEDAPFAPIITRDLYETATIEPVGSRETQTMTQQPLVASTTWVSASLSSPAVPDSSYPQVPESMIATVVGEGKEEGRESEKGRVDDNNTVQKVMEPVQYVAFELPPISNSVEEDGKVPAFIKEVRYKILNTIHLTRTIENIQDRKETLKSILHETANNLFLGKMPISELAIVAKVKRPLSSYSITKAETSTKSEQNMPYYTRLPAHMRAAKMLGEVNNQNPKVGDSIAYVMTTGRSDVRPAELTNIGEIDIRRYIDMLKSSVEQITTAFNINFDKDVIGMPTEQKLDRFWIN